jgi:chromosome segregation ATPase
MKKYLLAAAIVSMLFACKNKQEEQQQAQLKSVSADDSLLNLKTRAQDSTITAYVKSMNDIEDNLDSIKAKAKIMTVSTGATEGADQKQMIISDMRYIGNLMMKNKEQLAMMKRKLNESGMKNLELQKMIAHLTEELTQKDADIAALQSQLAETNANLKTEIQKFNDSMQVISNKNATISEQNVVYYAVGTTKELKNKGVIMKTGGVLGVGGTEELKPNTNITYFTSADFHTISALPLYSKFDKIITSHPNGSYKITGGKEADSLVITDQKLFWSESKYLVVIVKQR